MAEIARPKKLFDCQEMKTCMHDILHQNLRDEHYDTHQANSLAKNLSNTIKDALKSLGYERYKFIVQIFICQEPNESLPMLCRSYWDSESDRSAQSIYINPFLVCVATVFAVFYY